MVAEISLAILSAALRVAAANRGAFIGINLNADLARTPTPEPCHPSPFG
jgi:hypothetical protein